MPPTEHLRFGVGGQDRAVTVKFHVGGVTGCLDVYLGLEPCHTGEVQRGKEDRGYFSLPIEHRIPEDDDGLPGDPSNDVLADGKRLVLEHILKIRPIGKILRSYYGDSAGNHLTIRPTDHEIRILGTVLQEPGENFARGFPAIKENRHLRQYRENLMGLSNDLLFMKNREVEDFRHPLFDFRNIQSSLIPRVEAGQQDDRKEGQHHKEDQLRPDA